MNGRRWDEEEIYDDPDAPQDCDLTDNDGESDVVDCPHCGASISEFAERCPNCGDWITDSGGGRRSAGFVVLAILLLASFLAWIVIA